MRDILYASPAFAFAIPTFPVMIFLPALYTENFGLTVGKVGFFLFIAKIIDIFTDPLVGWINDKKILSRKILLLIGSFISGVSLYKLFLIREIPYEEYLLVWIGLLYLGWTMFQIPYLSIGYDLEKSYYYRTKLSATRETFVLIGLFSSLCIPMILKIDNLGLAEYLVKIAMISGFIGVFFLCFFIEEKDTRNRTIPLKTSFANLSSNIRLIKILTIWFINSLANVFPMILFAFYITYVLGGDDYDRQKTLFFYFLFAIMGVPFWTHLSKKTDKTVAWSISLILSAFIFIFVIFLNPGDFLIFIIISCITGLCLGADLVIPPSIQADVLDFDKLQTKSQRAGLLFSLWGMATKLALACSVGLAFPLLDWLEFDPDTPSVGGRNALVFLYALLPIGFKCITVVTIWNFPLDRKRHGIIKRRLYGTAN